MSWRRSRRRQFAHGPMPTGRSRRMPTAVTAHTLMTARTIRCTIIQRAVSGRIWQSRRRTGRLYITTIPRRRLIIFQLPVDIRPMERSGAPAKTRFRIWKGSVWRKRRRFRIWRTTTHFSSLSRDRVSRIMIPRSRCTAGKQRLRIRSCSRR